MNQTVVLICLSTSELGIDRGWNMQSEFYGLRFRGLIGNIIARVLLPFVMLKCKEFWGLREAALKGGRVLKKCYRIYVAKYGAEIPLSVKFEGPPCLPHGLHGIFIGNLTHIGKNVTIMHQVTIGQDTFSTLEDNAKRFIGDNVFIGAGAKIIGGVRIGNNCRIGANCCVYSDMPPNTVAVNQPTRFIFKKDLVNDFRRGDKVFRNGQWLNAGLENDD